MVIAYGNIKVKKGFSGVRASFLPGVFKKITKR